MGAYVAVLTYCGAWLNRGAGMNSCTLGFVLLIHGKQFCNRIVSVVHINQGGLYFVLWLESLVD